MNGLNLTAPVVMRNNEDAVRNVYNELALRGKRIDYGLGGQRSQRSEILAMTPCLKPFQSFFANVGEAFPNYELVINYLKTRGDKVMARYSISGTMVGHFMGLAPNNQMMTVSGIDVFRLDSDGQIVEYWDAAHKIEAKR